MNTMISNYTENGSKPLQTCGNVKATHTDNEASAFARTLQRRETDHAAQGVSCVRDMTMEEYKQYIAQKIRQFPVHPSRRNEYISVTISEEGYAAMKADPEYEAWVLNDLRSACAQPGFCFGTEDRVYTNLYYGASREECRAETRTVPGRSASDRARRRREESRRRLAKRIKKQKLQRHLRELAFQRQERQRKLVNKLIRHRQEVEAEHRKQWKKASVKDKPDGSRVLEITTKTRVIEEVTEQDILRLEEVLQKMQLHQRLRIKNQAEGASCETGYSGQKSCGNRP